MRTSGLAFDMCHDNESNLHQKTRHKHRHLSLRACQHPAGHYYAPSLADPSTTTEQLRSRLDFFDLYGMFARNTLLNTQLSATRLAQA
eukprot:4991566-Amphidinium_carterae.1